MNTDVTRPDVRDVQRRFDRVARDFEGADFVHRATFAGLVERLEPIVLAPREILDLGSACGRGSRDLARRYRKSRVIGLDISAGMLAESRRSRSFLSRVREVQADAARLPFRTGAIDLVIANLVIPWIGDPTACFAEVARVLKDGGLFAFATLGPDSFAELSRAWQAVDSQRHVPDFPDMHDVGDALVRAGLRDPVLDVDTLRVTFPGVDELLHDLTLAGARNCLASRRPGLTGRQGFDRFRQQLSGMMNGGRLPLRLELVYGHAWGAGPATAAGEYRVAPGSIGRRRRP